MQKIAGLQSLEILRNIQEDLDVRKKKEKPEQFEGIILFMSMVNDIDGTRGGNPLDCISNSKKVRDYAKRFQRGH